MHNNNCSTIFKLPTHKFRFDTNLKKVARDQIYFDHTKTFYCGCNFFPNAQGASGVIEPLNCGYKIKNSNSNRGKNLEWEHIVPASAFGKHKNAWINHKKEEFCGIKSKSGRECARKFDDKFKMMEADLYNLVPEIGELNSERSDKLYGKIDGEKREYGECDFEISSKSKLVEPAEHIQGNIARAWLYMYITYGPEMLPTSDKELKMFCDWHNYYPANNWEKIMDERITIIQGNLNPYIDGSFIEYQEICGVIKSSHDEL